MSRRYITVAETAEHLQISEKTVRRLIADGQLSGYRIGRSSHARIRIDLDEIDEQLMRPMAEPPRRPRKAGSTRTSARPLAKPTTTVGARTVTRPRQPTGPDPLDETFWRYCQCGDRAISHIWTDQTLDERIGEPRPIGSCAACSCKEFLEDIKRRRKKRQP
ncbi:helix-turn-helix domain-containing protein [Mycobacterium sp. AZCC_0083]|uniref:helix-turn-helix domain-containing protein n=1 Tax=Mycobacterium sp. AZCC_0083 TaxID=2735882 RepID=UPI0017FAA857|nr:helix-turn-helix domain-containing protein [Mycobacterium sp. AZCC_0083]MBB5164942.1 excisionase family DNA binding protein [Mycobacterium sp. AZCC_0083]